MTEAIVMPMLGNTVESAIILTWHAEVGDAIRAGDGQRFAVFRRRAHTARVSRFERASGGSWRRSWRRLNCSDYDDSSSGANTHDDVSLRDVEYVLPSAQ